MARLSSAILVLLAVAAAAAAQPAPPVEHVTVTGTRTRAVMDQYIQNFAVPTRMTGKLTRWQDGVCPQVVGMKPQFADAIAKRILKVAQDVGAPVGGPGCRTNIQVVFTTAPQALMDNVRQHQPDYLGYADTASGRDRLAIVTRPVQAWYSTATRDLDGQVEVDGQKTMGTTVDLPPVQPGGDMHVSTSAPLELSGARIVEVTGLRLGDGVTSELHHVIIVAEPGKLLDHEVGELADYIAMLSLTQLASLDGCQPLPSIVNLLVKDCAGQALALTDNDLAYLKGLYKMSPDRNARSQADQIGYQMQQSLEGK
jgi:hypothetical protein